MNGWGRATGYPCRRGNPADRGGGRAALPRLPGLGYRAAGGVRPAGPERRAQPGMAAGAGPGRRRRRQPGTVRRRHRAALRLHPDPGVRQAVAVHLIQGTALAQLNVSPGHAPGTQTPPDSAGRPRNGPHSPAPPKKPLPPPLPPLPPPPPAGGLPPSVGLAGAEGDPDGVAAAGWTRIVTGVPCAAVVVPLGVCCQTVPGAVPSGPGTVSTATLKPELCCEASALAWL